MASDRDRFKFALKGWEILHDYKQFSVPREQGKVAIFCATPSEAGFDSPGNRKKQRKDFKIFTREASTIAGSINDENRIAEIIYNPVDSDFSEVLQDPSFSDIITIGNGTLGVFFVEGEPCDFDWFDVAMEADHLKTGLFIQRHCGHFGRNFNLPLGTFAVSSFSNVIAPAGNFFYPRGLQHPDNDLLIRALEDVEITYSSLKAHFN